MIITIGGQYGCGGKRIAAAAARLLGYTLCDDDLVAKAVQDSKADLEESTFRYFDESQGKASLRELSALSSVQANFHNLVTSLTMDTLPLDRRMDQAQEAVFRQLAQQGNCIVLGRCADYYLRDVQDRISLFVIDDLDARVERIMEHFSIDRSAAVKAIKKTDQRRSDYYSFFTGRAWGSMDNYDLILRCSLMGVEGSAALLSHIVAQRKQA